MDEINPVVKIINSIVLKLNFIFPFSTVNKNCRIFITQFGLKIKARLITIIDVNINKKFVNKNN